MIEAAEPAPQSAAANAVLLQVRSAGGDDVVFKGRLAL